MSSYLFTQAQTDLNNSVLDLSTGVYYAHLVTSVPNPAVTTVSGLVLPTVANYAPKVLTGLIYNATKWTFDDANFPVLSYGIAPVGTVICKQTGSSPANTDRVICYSDRSQILTPGNYGINEKFSSDGCLRFVGDSQLLGTSGILATHLRCLGNPGSNFIQDETGKAWSNLFGTPTIDSTVLVNGDPTINLRGGKSISTPNNPDFVLGTEDFTIYCDLFLPNSITSDLYIASIRSSPGPTPWSLYVYGSGTNGLTYSDTLEKITGASLSVGRNVIEISRKSGILKVFINGTIRYSGVSSQNMTAQSSLKIGSAYSQDVNNSFSLAEFFILKGVAYHDVAYTPRTYRHRFI